MAVRPSAYDHRRDLVLATVDERIADLHAIAHASHRASAPSRGLVAGLRDALGGRLIGLGVALATDEAVRRRPALRSDTRPPRTMAT